jgi:hypothetical protein
LGPVDKRFDNNYFFIANNEITAIFQKELRNNINNSKISFSKEQRLKKERNVNPAPPTNTGLIKIHKNKPLLDPL